MKIIGSNDLFNPSGPVANTKSKVTLEPGVIPFIAACISGVNALLFDSNFMISARGFEINIVKWFTLNFASKSKSSSAKKAPKAGKTKAKAPKDKAPKSKAPKTKGIAKK